MKAHQPIPFKIPKSDDHAILVQVDEAPFFYNQLHYHPEIQITAIVKGEGILYAGNSMSAFSENEVYMIGANVPHLLKSSNPYFGENSPGVKGISLFFDKFSFGRDFFKIGEMQRLQSTLNDSRRVIKVTGEFKNKVFNKITSSTTVINEQLVIVFLEILALARKSGYSCINEEQYSPILNNDEGSRLNEVLDFTFKNFNKEITIDQISKIAFLSRSQFSYFFKVHTGKTYINFLNELRIENACILLKNNRRTIEQICYEVGFRNSSNFVRHFKKIKHETPSSYRKSWNSL